MNEELKRCPFCGGEDIHLRFKECVNALGCMNGYYYVECQYCATVSGCSSKENVAIEDWNTRPEEDRLKAENERSKEELEESLMILKQIDWLYSEENENARMWDLKIGGLSPSEWMCDIVRKIREVIENNSTKTNGKGNGEDEF